MVGKTPANIVAISSLRDGVISMPDVTGEVMLRHFIRKAHAQLLGFPYPRPALPRAPQWRHRSREAVHDAALEAGAREAYLIEEPMAAALGAGLPVTEPQGV